MKRCLLVLSIAAALLPLPLYAAGFERVPIMSSPPIDAGIWYPSLTREPREINTPFRQALAIDGQLNGHQLPMIVLSHGDGGWMGGHADTAKALADAGYIAVALEHPGNNSEDENAPPAEWLVSRPKDLSTVIDFMLSEWPGAERIDSDRIGVFGFSAGGYTALVASGATPDFLLAERHCNDMPEEFVCSIGLMDDIDPTALAERFHEHARDSRIASISIAAPGFGFAFDRNSLEQVTIPVQIWSGMRDDRVPHDTNGANIATNLPEGVDVQLVENAGHFAFLTECNPLLEEANPGIWKMVCVDPEGFDRAEFHRHMNRTVIDFFNTTLQD